MDVNKICPNCMKEAEGNICPHCGYDKSKGQDIIHALRPLSILLGKYLIGNVLGEGGFGITYIGYDLNLELKIAVKEFYPNGFVTRESNISNAITEYTVTDASRYQKWKDSFLTEARNLAKFSSLPGIVHVRDFFQENNTAYIIMEYVEGETLKSHLKKSNSAISVDETLSMMKPVIKSLSKVHATNLIHRDISPDNIMIEKGGEIKLIDFGAAREFNSDDQKSRSVLLKPGYAPEEQYRSRGVLGPWTDVYALCATIYRCITGKKPVESTERMRTDTLEKPSDLGVKISPEIEATILRGMAVYSENRIQSMDELYGELYGAPFTVRKEPEKTPAIVENGQERKKPKDTVPSDSKKKQAEGGKGKKQGGSKKLLVIGASLLAVILLFFLVTSMTKEKKEVISDTEEEELAAGDNEVRKKAKDAEVKEIEEEEISGSEASASSGVVDELKNSLLNQEKTKTEEPVQKKADEVKSQTEEDEAKSQTEEEEDTGIHRYEYVVADVTWEEAYEQSINKGGYLCHINSDEEAAHILGQIELKDLGDKSFFIGGRRKRDSLEYHWVDRNGNYSEEIINNNPKYDSYWLAGEPSFSDENGKDEKYLDMIYKKSDNHWYFNDIPNDIIQVSPYFAGKVGYIIEYEE
ncbi:MAG: protein kinase [Lachnospiraceae bacterium]|nr:protein kinase [Lachnospiraceae bacterium]